MIDVHPWHVTYAEATWRPTVLEVALRIDPPDLELALSTWMGAPVTLEDDDVERVMHAWIHDRIHVNRAVPEWVGYELDGPWAWLYVEYPVEGTTLRLEQRIGLTLHPGQVNTVDLRQEDGVRRLHFDASSPLVVLMDQDEAVGIFRTWIRRSFEVTWTLARPFET
ncbi:MAG: hypothetical protein KDA28_07720 [Phycisphaerales bacterium]|nr:hypothetical protein [Phycisphaerales bacterium]